MSFASLLQALQHPAIRAPIAVSFGAIAGALCRYYLTLWCSDRFGLDFPYGTFVINISGCVLMGVISTLALPPTQLAPETRLLLTTGFLGAYTTFSTYGLDSLNLWRMQHWKVALGYWLGSPALGFVGVQLGVMLGQWLRRG